jgi:hypothetical protein
LNNELQAEEIPARDDFHAGPGETDEERAKRMGTGQRLRDALEKKVMKKTEQIATGHELFYFRTAQLPMAGDFLFASIANPACRMFHYFDLVARLYLGIPVTPKRCHLGDCDDSPVLGYGDHAVKHCSAKSTWRHNEVRDTLVRHLRTVSRNNNISWEVNVEPWLREYGFRRKADALVTSDARADIMLCLPERNWSYFIDLTIPQIIPGKLDAKSLLKVSYEKKFRRYDDNYENINPAQITPLVFGSIGVWEERTVTFLQLTFKAIARAVVEKRETTRDEDVLKELTEGLYNKLFSEFRSQVAIRLAKSLGSMLNWLLWKNTIPGKLPLDETPVKAPLSHTTSKEQLAGRAAIKRKRSASDSRVRRTIRPVVRAGRSSSTSRVWVSGTRSLVRAKLKRRHRASTSLSNSKADDEYGA